MKRQILFLWAALLLIGLAVVFAWRATGFDRSRYGRVEYNLTYCTLDGQALLMDVYYPNSSGPWPALVFVHAGGWTTGDKNEVDPTPASSGYLVVSINYRLYPDHRFPAMIEDVKCAVRSLRAHARWFNIDPKRIAMAGHSAGGQLAALAGLADESAGWDVGPYRDQSSRVQAVIVQAGPADLTRDYSQWVNEMTQAVFGPQQLVSGSPVTYASPDDPPVLIIHGEADSMVPVEQAHLLYKALVSAGAPAELILVQNGGHGFEPMGRPVSPTGEELVRMELEFLDHSLGQQP